MRPATRKQLRLLGYGTYRAYLLSGVWKKRRERYFRTHARACWICGTSKAIHLHHANYERIGGKERDADLVPLCSSHHRGLHTFAKRGRVRVEDAHVAYARYLARRRRG
jgi:5-methylcytosine-specific restriction endonuclease McrA